MAIVVPFEAPDGSVKRGWYRITNSKAGSVVMKALPAPPLYVRKATELIMKLADGVEVTRSEKQALLILASLWMISSNKCANQIQGFKLMKEVLGDDPAEITEDLRQAALRDLGLGD